MRFSFFAILFCLFIVSCTDDTGVQLDWDIPETQTYHITRESFPGDLVVDAAAMLADKKLLDKNLSALKAISLNPATFPMLLEMRKTPSNEIMIIAKNVVPKSNTDASDEDSNLQKLQQSSAGLIQLNTKIDLSGKNLHSFLKPQQKNFVNLLFKLPELPVKAGDVWELPVNLSELSTAFIANETQRYNQVWINSVKNLNGKGKVLEIVYLLQENITGTRQQLTTDEPKPFSIVANYFAVGEYHIEKRQWLTYRGRLDTSVGVFRNIELIALSPVLETN